MEAGKQLQSHRKKDGLLWRTETGATLLTKRVIGSQ